MDLYDLFSAYSCFPQIIVVSDIYRQICRDMANCQNHADQSILPKNSSDLNESGKLITFHNAPLIALDLESIFHLTSKLAELYISDAYLESLQELKSPIFLMKIMCFVIGRMRFFISPHTIAFGTYLYRWDSQCADIFLNMISRSSPIGSWRRLFRNFILESWNLDNFNLTWNIQELVQAMLIAVEERNIAALYEYLPSIDKTTENSPDPVYGNALKYISPAQIGIATLNGMSLLHCAAIEKSQDFSNSPNNEVKIMSCDDSKYTQVLEMLMQSGCDCTATDFDLRTPLHCAANSLNWKFIAFVSIEKNKSITRSRIALEMRDKQGNRPIDTFIRSLSLCKWRLTIASTHIESMLVSLLPWEEMESIWSFLPGPPCLSQDNTDSSSVVRSRPIQGDHHIASLCVLYGAVVFGDDAVATTALNIAKQSVKTRNSAVLIAILTACIKRRREKTAIAVLQEFGEGLLFERPDADHLLNASIAAAILADSMLLANIFLRLLSERLAKPGGSCTSLPFPSFMFIAALCAKGEVTKTILSASSSQSLWRLLSMKCAYDLNDSPTAPPTWINDLCCSRSSSIEIESLFQKISPLCLFAMLPGRADAVHLLLKATAHWHGQGQGQGQTDGPLSRKECYYAEAMGAAILCNNSDSLAVFRSFLGNKAFAEVVLSGGKPVRRSS